MRIRGHLYRPGSSERVEAVLARDGGGRFRLVRADGDDAGRDVGLRVAGPLLAGVPRTIALDTGERFVPFEEPPGAFLGETGTGPWRRVTSPGRVTPFRMAVLAALVVLAIAGLRAAAPVAADLAAALVPHRTEALMGELAFREIDALALEPSELAESHKARLRAAARALARLGGVDPAPEVRFRRAPALGANAFAFPGGPILVTDELVELLGDDDRVVAVLAHELGHVEARHGLRQALRIGGVFLIASLALGGDETLMEELVALTVSIDAAGYSRTFEREADAFAGRLLPAAGRSPGDLADALRILIEDCGERCEGGGWLSTHPDASSRIEALTDRPGTD